MGASTLEIPGNTEWCEKEKIYREADVISLHVPLTLGTRNMVTKRELVGIVFAPNFRRNKITPGMCF